MASKPYADIAVDPKNGEDVSILSRPSYDQSIPYSSEIDTAASKVDTQENIKHLVDTAWKNRSLTDTFEPNSTFKAVTAAIVLEEGIVTPETPVDDNPFSFSVYNVNCWRKGKLHGKQTFKEAVYNFCNPVFARAVQNLGIDKFYTYMRNFGFYDKSGLELPGEAESIISPKPAEIDITIVKFINAKNEKALCDKEENTGKCHLLFKEALRKQASCESQRNS